MTTFANTVSETMAVCSPLVWVENFIPITLHNAAGLSDTTALEKHVSKTMQKQPNHCSELQRNRKMQNYSSERKATNMLPEHKVASPQLPPWSGSAVGMVTPGVGV